MAIFDRLLRLKKDAGKEDRLKPLHVAMTMQGSRKWLEKNKGNEEKLCDMRLANMARMLQSGIRMNIPIMTFFTLPVAEMKEENVGHHMDCIGEHLNRLSNDRMIHENQVRISVLGKWYDLQQPLIDSIKKIIDETRDYDRFFVNFCINYNGRTEILNGAQLIAKQVEMGKMKADDIDADLFKENIYSSFLLPPDLIIKTGEKKMTSLLLWDVPGAIIYFADKPWMEFDEGDFKKAVDYFRKGD